VNARLGRGLPLEPRAMQADGRMLDEEHMGSLADASLRAKGIRHKVANQTPLLERTDPDAGLTCH